MITVINESFSQTLSNGLVWTAAIFEIALFLAFYVLRAIGLFVLAKRQNEKRAFLAWIPCVWMYTAVKLVKKVRLFNRPFEKFAIWFCIIFSISQVLTFVTNFIIYFPLVGNFLMGRNIVMADSVNNLQVGYNQWTDGVYVGQDFVDPYGSAHNFFVTLLKVLGYVSVPFDLLNIFVTVIVYINLFKCYWPQHYILAAILSIIGLFAPFIFVIRKKDPVDYMDYVRSRYNYYNYPYGNPYGGTPYGGNPYGAPNGQNQNRPPETPFSEFAEKGEVDPGDPFEEFNDKDQD